MLQIMYKPKNKNKYNKETIQHKNYVLPKKKAQKKLKKKLID